MGEEHKLHGVTSAELLELDRTCVLTRYAAPSRTIKLETPRGKRDIGCDVPHDPAVPLATRTAGDIEEPDRAEVGP